jgi:glucose-6-phosphate 1-dehydrogenase
MEQRDPETPRGRSRGGRSAPPPCTMVIFGASGDLTRRKLVPALYNLALDGLLPERFAVVGVARRPIEGQAFVETLAEGIRSHSRRPLSDDRWQDLARNISYIAANTDDSTGYDRLSAHLDELDQTLGTGGNRLFYMATPPSAFTVIVERLGRAGLQRPGTGGSWARIVVEKPIGHDLVTARRLNRAINDVFAESSVFRIDHYLGKETVQNLLVFRFANAIFEPLWNQKYIDHVQLTVAETLGVEGRGSYYEEAGTTRDMVQNHIFQLLCLIAMEPPVSLEADTIRDEKVKVLRALRPVDPDQIYDTSVRAQYAAGVIGNEKVIGYRDEPGVAADSCTETYVSARLEIDNWRWAGVPFYVRAGKRMSRRITEIALRFRDVPHRLFSNDPLTANTLALQVQPDEGISLTFDAKVPGTSPRIQPVGMDFKFGGSFKAGTPAAYERLILDAIIGDSTLFIRGDEVEAAWAYTDRLHEGWDAAPQATLPQYTAGTWGPAEAEVLLARDRRTWRRPD